MRCYLDYNASAPILEEVKNKVVTTLDVTGNPSSIHRAGRESRQIIEKSREELATTVNADTSSIIFTSGATEANNLVINTFEKIIASRMEHESILERNNIKYVDVTADGYVNMESLEKAAKDTINKNKTLISIMFANNETGIIQPIKEINKIAKKNNILFHTDAVQAMGRVLIDFKDLECDFLTISSHKIGGPKGAGALLVKDKTALKALQVGGAQEHNLRAGTESVSAIAGFGMAAKLINLEEMHEIKNLRDFFENELKKINKDVIIIGSQSQRLPNTFKFCIPGISANDILIALDIEGFEVSSGSACSSGKIQTSKTLEAMGLPYEISNSSVRVSLGPYNNYNQAKKFANTVKKIRQRFLNKKL